ncbi:hypothetical protein DPMN_084719 [Dreissena polymorpha]|uniref:Uncharacterized protein n=1 Tax=Dreissena polymorpha TaxID=45954 RepID=A0A9D3YB23_DREPO|nr:hypothetical protein DPMN_084719 [Dreissena polymorpha]
MQVLEHTTLFQHPGNPALESVYKGKTSPLPLLALLGRQSLENAHKLLAVSDEQ